MNSHTIHAVTILSKTAVQDQTTGKARRYRTKLTTIIFVIFVSRKKNRYKLHSQTKSKNQ